MGYGEPGLAQKFTGQLRDGESGLDYFGARHMASAQGRFTSPDPLMASAHVVDPQSWNRYTYAWNNPLRYNDPLGLFPSPAYNCSDTQTNCLNDEQRRILENSKVKVGNETLSGEKLWNAVGKNAKEREAIQNAFVNVTDRLASVQLASGGTALGAVSSVTSLETDRIKANVSTSIFDTISASTGFKEVSGALHPGFDYRSYKSRDNEGNIQFSFGSPGASGRPTSADIDHDLNQGWRHALEVMKNHATRGTTSQDAVRQLLLRRPEVAITPSTDPKWNRR
jgi:RHS repeat-associated protein